MGVVLDAISGRRAAMPHVHMDRLTIVAAKKETVAYLLEDRRHAL